jgi:hypothetical protein
LVIAERAILLQGGADMNRQDMVRFWGEENLLRWTSADVSALNIPESSKTFLVEVGLPLKGDWMWEFEWEKDLPRMPGRPQARCLGYSFGSPIVLDELRSGCVTWAQTQSDKERYQNASVEQFAESLVEYQKLAVPWGSAAARSAVSSFRRILDRIDSTAFDDPENAWSRVVEDLEYQSA